MRVSNLNNSNFLANFYFLFHYFSTSITFKHFYGWSSECIIELKSRFLQKIKIPKWKPSTWALSAYWGGGGGHDPEYVIELLILFVVFIYVPINILYIDFNILSVNILNVKYVDDAWLEGEFEWSPLVAAPFLQILLEAKQPAMVASMQWMQLKW